jgi:hypothetical protein
MYIDIHNHPTVKPFGHTCKYFIRKKLEITPQYLNYGYLQTNHPEILRRLPKPCKKSSLWHKNWSHFLFNRIFSELAFAKYTQSNFSDAIKGNTRILFVSLYPIEKEYMTKTWDERIFGIPILKNFVTGISSKRIKFIQSDKYKYFNDLSCEYEFLKTFQHYTTKKGGTYFIAENFDHLNQNLSEEDKNKVGIILTIEGSNTLYPTKNIIPQDINDVLHNIQQIKQWPHRVLWMSLAHHFFNGFISHEKSLIEDIVLLGNIDQSYGMNTPVSNIPEFEYYTENGIKVIKALLSTDNGYRILPDLKHADFRARKQYYRLLKTDYNNEVPVVLSHAAVGSPNEHMPPYFNAWTINLNDDDIYALCATQGITGIEFDQRLLGFTELRKYNKQKKIKSCRLSKKFSVDLVWNSIRYIAEKAAAYKTAEPEIIPISEPWEIMAIGTDFDGVINPINKFPTLASMPELKEMLQERIDAYLNSSECDANVKTLTKSTPQQIADAIFYGNAYRFLQTHFR